MRAANGVPGFRRRAARTLRLIGSLVLCACLSVPDRSQIGNRFGPLPEHDSIAVVEFNDLGFALQDASSATPKANTRTLSATGALQSQAVLDYVDDVIARTRRLDSTSVRVPGQPRIRRQVLVLAHTHGWHNNANPQRGDFVRFEALTDSIRRNLTRGFTHDLEQARTNPTPDDSVVDSTTVVPIYLAWRGRQYKGLADYLTFWSRKEVAERVGAGEYAVLVRALSERKRRWTRTPGLERNMLVLSGHSFGGAALLSATLPSLARHLLELDGPASDSAPPPADLIVAINPAIEANVLQRSVLSDLTRTRVESVTVNKLRLTALPPQGGPRADAIATSAAVPTPTRLAILDAENDRARQLWFPLGRRVGAFPFFWSTTASLALAYGFRADKSLRFTAALPWVIGLARASRSTGWTAGEATAAGRLRGQAALRAELSPRTPDAACLNATLPTSGQGRILLRALDDATAARTCANPVKVVSVSSRIIDGHNGLWGVENMRFVQELLLSNMRKSRVEQDARNKARVTINRER